MGNIRLWLIAPALLGLSACNTSTPNNERLATAQPASTQQKVNTSDSGQTTVSTFTTHISDRDKIDSKGRKLTDPRDIVLQDRKNYYDYNQRDPKDQPTLLFGSKEDRFSNAKPVTQSRWVPNDPNNPSKGSRWEMTHGVEYELIKGNPDITVTVHDNGAVNVSPAGFDPHTNRP